MNENRTLCGWIVKTAGRFLSKEEEKKSKNSEDDNLSMLADGIETFEMDEIMEFVEVTYSECENIEQAILMIESCEELKDTEKVLFLTVQLDDTFGSNDVQKLSQKCKKNSIVIFLESKTGRKFSILWKSKDVESFYTFGHYSMVFEEADRKIYKFIAEFLAKSLKRKHLGINTACLKDKEVTTILLTDLVDHRGYSPLLVALQQNNNEMAKIMLNLGSSTKSLDGTVAAQSLAWNARNSEVLLHMAKSNLEYPAGIDPSELSDEFRVFYKETQQLHAAVMAKDKEQVEKILKTRQHKLRFHFNLNNESAASVAIKQGSRDIYEILLRHDVFLFEDGLLSELSETKQMKIRDLHTKYKKESDDKHINFLYSRSHAAHDAMDTQDNMKHVIKAYELMAQNSLLNVILRVVAAVRKFDIYFDFKRDAPNVIDPTTDKTMRGVFYPRGQIFIGAKQLLNEEEKFQTISTIAHELCHFACKILYDNDAKPFAKDDNITRELFEKISEICKASKYKDEVVRRAYDEYGSDDVLAELIVRAPQMLALYFDQPEKQRECRASYPELFRFYETLLVPIMERAIPEIEARTEREIEEKDEKILKYKFLWLISIILAIVGIVATIFIVQAIFFKPVYTLNTLDPFDHQKVKDGSVLYKGILLRLQDLFSNDSPAYQNLTSEHIAQIFDGIPLDFSSPHLVYLDSQVHHNWQNMSEKLKDKVLNSNFTFQNESLALANLKKSVPNAFNSLTSEQIVEILDGNLVIGAMIANKTKFYVERKLGYFSSELYLGEYNFTWTWTWNILNNEVKDRAKEMLLSLDLITNYTDWTLITSDEFCNNINGTHYNCSVLFDIFYNTSEIINRTQLSRFFILSDEAGSGKSVTFQQLTMRVKRKFPDHWVSYLDLKDYTRFYDSKKISNDPLDVLKEILDLKSKSQFELKVFEELFRAGKVVLFWDGFDGISPTFSEQVIRLMKSNYENSSNVQYVSTRPIYAKLLENNFNPERGTVGSTPPRILGRIVNKCYGATMLCRHLANFYALRRQWSINVNIDSKTLKPYTISEKEEFLRKFFISENVNESEIAKLTEKVLNISKKFEYETPLMLTLIAEVHEDLKNIETLNLYKIYETFVERKIRIWQEKSEYNKNIALKLLANGVSMKKIYQKFAIRKEMKGSWNIPRLKIMKTKLPKELSFDEISRMGILYINTESIFRFAHRTFGEFFVAQFLVENFFELDHDEPFDDISFDLFYDEDMSMMIKYFLIDYIEVQKFNGTVHYHPEIEKLLMQKHKNYFFSMLWSLYSDFPNHLNMFLPMFSKNHNLLVDMLHVNEEKTLYTAYFDLTRFDKWRNNGDTISEEIKKAVSEFLTPDELSKFLTGKGQKGVILHSLAMSVFQGLPEHHPEFSLGNVNVTRDYIDNFYENVKENLTKTERQHLLVAILSLPLNSSMLRSTLISLDRYEKLWQEGKNFLGKEDIKSIIAKMLSLYYVKLQYVYGFDELFDFVLDKANTTFSSDETFELFKTKQLFFKGFNYRQYYPVPYFEKRFRLLLSRTTKEQQKEIILQEFEFDGDDVSRDAREQLFYEASGVKLFHYLLLEKYSTELGFPLTNWFSEDEIREIILSSNDFILAHMLTTVYSEWLGEVFDFLKSLEKYFVGHEKDLIKFLTEKKISGTNYTISTYCEVILNGLSDYYQNHIKSYIGFIKESIERLKATASKNRKEKKRK